MPVGHQEHEK